MQLDHNQCYAIIKSRDVRYDGRFFADVTTTGIYCRPICPARTPQQEHMLFFPSASAAAEAGFRPCLRCRPEASPGFRKPLLTRVLRFGGPGAPMQPCFCGRV